MSYLFMRLLFTVNLVSTILFSYGTAYANNDHDFFNSVEGDWKGPGKIVAGKYKGTKFTCSLKGARQADKNIGISMDGSCRVGVFNQPMNAVIIKDGKHYKGTFLDGAKGKGIDIVSGQFNKYRGIIGINRDKLNGAMVADFLDPDTMNVTVSVKVGNSMIPVIGMTLSRKLSHKTSLSP